jgi:UPF0271 protein
MANLSETSKGTGQYEPVDLNCDMGEGIGNDERIMPYISSANIACGYHAGDEKTIWQTIGLAVNYNVAVGAHVSFFDKENFGRNEMDLGSNEIYDLVTQQLIIIGEIAEGFPVKLNHVKPHGALYNMSAKDPLVATTIAKAVKDFDANLVLFGLSNSHSLTKASEIGLKTASEVFADRMYLDDGRLAPRSQPGALIEDADRAVRQVLQMIKQKTVTTISGKTISIIADTICIHGDGKHAIAFAKNISDAIKNEGIGILPRV